MLTRAIADRKPAYPGKPVVAGGDDLPSPEALERTNAYLDEVLALAAKENARRRFRTEHTRPIGYLAQPNALAFSYPTPAGWSVTEATPSGMARRAPVLDGEAMIADPASLRVGSTVVAVVDLPAWTRANNRGPTDAADPVAVGTIGVVVGKRLTSTAVGKLPMTTTYRIEVVFSPDEDGEPIRRYVDSWEIAKVPVDTKLRKAHPRRVEGGRSGTP